MRIRIESRIIHDLEVTGMFTVDQLKQRIAKIEEIPIRRVSFGSMTLEDEHVLSYYGIRDGDTLVAKTSESNLLEKATINNLVPLWRTAKKGFFLIGECNNTSCEASGDTFVCNLGFGKFLIREMVCKCPLCENVSSVIRVGFGFCKITDDTGERRIVDFLIGEKSVLKECIVVDFFGKIDFVFLDNYDGNC
jgi:hypothetical protein